ncbi:hypothetical protein RYZ26_13015 [Terasakiella sp. A23]|uniref:hypothetical protein n=1 Tax=Terasakiella sp. FCG-A23 TaxID=3080561 RepID=UPI002952DE39|nr:hypothetical protein [Terasakiella sp. A23]MDV7340519.1 hypothetical protein [Terasakiella sp. A23]
MKNIKKYAGFILLCLTLTSCMSTNKHLKKNAEISLKADTALVLLTMQEIFVFKPGKASVVLRSDEGQVVLDSLARFSGPQDMDRKHRGGATSYVAMEVPAGEYSLSRWFFKFRLGHSYEKPKTKSLKFDGGNIYYLGHFTANNFSEAGQLEAKFEDDKGYFLEKYPSLKSQEIVNVSKDWALSCWPTNQTLKYHKLDLVGKLDETEKKFYAKDLNRCFPK